MFFLALSLAALMAALCWAASALSGGLVRLVTALESLGTGAAEADIADDGAALAETLAGLGRR